MPRTDRLFLGHMLDTLERITELVGRTTKEEFDGDWVLQSALMRELEVLGEAAGRLSAEFVKLHPEIPWREITGIRHKLIHDYFEVDTAVVWRTATKNVPEVAPLLAAAAKDLRP